jgi:hypothetical protein
MRLSLGLLFLVVVSACSSEQQPRSFGETTPTEPNTDLGQAAEAPDEDPYANDPPPKWCGPKGGPSAPPPPGGTAECPDDKNKPGCACDEIGKQAACFTGLRANRSLGICKDGVTTCQRVSEMQNAWGPCEGEVLPEKGAKLGASACTCFSEGQWHIDAPLGCVVPLDTSYSTLYWVSTTQGSGGQPQCPDSVTGGQIPKKPIEDWSAQSLKADCAGSFELCIELRGGDVKSPGPNDCVLTKQCVKVDYLKEGIEQKLPPLDGWVSTNQACNQYWYKNGGYAQMTVKGVSVRCDEIDDGQGEPYVFHRWGYCPGECAANPNTPRCQQCVATGADGSF